MFMHLFFKATLKDESGNRAPAAMIDIETGKALKDRITPAPNGAGRLAVPVGR